MSYMAKDNVDHRTYKDLIQNRYPPYLVLSGFKGWLAGILSYGLLVPFLRPLLQKSFTIVSIALGRLRQKGDYTRFYALLINILLGSAFRKKDIYRWWYLMRFGVAVTQERQINWMIRDLIAEDNLILVGSMGPKPWQGYDVAYAFVGFSLWLFERGDIQGAINMIQIAIQADDTWGYPEYLHGWYGLFTTGVDSVSHFTKAVQTDWSFLQRMKQDKTCKQHPDVLHEVQRRTLVNSQ